MGKIILEDFNDGNGYYKINLAYLNKEQVEEIESVVSKWECLKGIKRVQEYQDLSDWEKKFDNIASMYAHNKNQEGYNESWYVKERAAAMLYHAKKELEKQGEQKHKIQPKFKIGDIIRFKSSETLKGEIEAHKIVDYDNELYVFDDGTTDLFCEQDLYELVEQKPVNKVEPKFKVGDWVVYNRDDYSREIMQIYDIRDGRYYFTDNVHFSWSIKECDEKSHLWTIQDAKDGDVLVNEDGLAFIYNGYLEEQQWPFAYGGINIYGRFNICDGLFPFTHQKVVPATKEQCDLLFSKMKEAGWEWDAELKQLRKIDDEEFNGEDYGIDSLYHAQRILEKTLGKVEGYQTDDGILSHQCAISAVKKLYKQKPAWSEEDEEMLNSIIEDFGDGKTSNMLQEYWLKSLRPHSQWKPSDLQIEALESATENCAYSEYQDCLRELIRQLKKLREE